ncbi:MAG TPA: hypothetical protein VK497_05610 [Candidatus Saccharimonadales bacterium]|nr:hypothetical protein [Candidatus Saccharimonadales bacterium]
MPYNPTPFSTTASTGMGAAGAGSTGLFMGMDNWLFIALALFTLVGAVLAAGRILPKFHFVGRVSPKALFSKKGRRRH